MKIAFIGIGNMSSAIVPHLTAQGHEIAVWNRSPEPLKKMHNVTILSSPEEAFFRYEVVITMLADDVAVRNPIMESRVLSHAKPGVIHVVMSTISPSLVGEMLTLHEKAQISYVAAPVFGYLIFQHIRPLPLPLSFLRQYSQNI